MKKCVVFVIMVCSLFFSASVDAEEPIHIGLSAPMTGQQAQYGQSMKKGIELAIDRINEAHGINGRPIRLVAKDTRGNLKAAKKIARRFTRDKRIVAEIGGFSSSASMAARAVYEKAGMVQLSPTASHPSFAPGSPWSFTINATEEDKGPFAARMAVEILGKKRLALLFSNDDWGTAARTFFINEAKRLGADILAQESFLRGTRDFTAIIKRLRAAKPELLCIISYYNDGAVILRQCREIGWDDVTVMGPNSMYSPALLELSGPAAENVYTFTTFFPKEPRAEVQKFVKEFEARYRSTPGLVAALGYDAMNLLSQAIKNGGADRGAIRDALAKISDFEGATGKIMFDKYGSRVLKDFLILQVKNGEYVLYSEKE
ncbi:ABC transporter substrate-binding protein [Desulfobacterales bacterium HSG2]|nr:ABC transporter substrate-binding protein [Desulfobacterales bacterium HSG2]